MKKDSLPSSLPENRLRLEKSPYLRQHARNPVDWYPWCSEAFQKAKQENKLIFLSIGYSTCHWCHVMERESFENPEIAALLNQDYVSIKVDREERPDIDHIYMTAVQSMTGAGGWPLTVFLTPEAEPITGGTYFPPQDKWGRMGMTRVLPHLAHLWKTEPDKMRAAGKEMTQLLQAKTREASALDLSRLFQMAENQFKNSFDEAHGGFGGAPKFPRSHDLCFLLRLWKKDKDPQKLHMVEKTLTSMALGGIYDHLGGGFHRYATDENWLVPHFEKMLYDQAVIARTYLEAFQATGNPLYEKTARGIFTYVLRDMTSPDGGFYSAEDADSEGEEGTFYVWRPQEIKNVLGPEGAECFMAYYGVTDEGNFEHASSILSVNGFSPAGAEGQTQDLKMETLRGKLFEARNQRIRPHRDEKILTGWNAMMISSLAYGAQVLGEPRYAQAAARGSEFIFKHLQKDGRLLRRCCDGESAGLGYQDDYAFFICALLDLYETDFDAKYFQEAERLTKEMIRLFGDPEQGGFFFTGTDAEALIARTKEYYDGAVPSGNSMAALALVRLARLTGNRDWEEVMEQLNASNAAALSQHPAAHSHYLSALSFFQGPSKEIVCAGRKDSELFQTLLQKIRRRFDPNRVLLYLSDDPEALKIGFLADFYHQFQKDAGSPRFYICEGRTCHLPVNHPDQLERILGDETV